MPVNQPETVLGALALERASLAKFYDLIKRDAK